MSDQVTVLVDADPLVYRVGFSLETRVWYTEWVDVDPEHPDDRDYDTRHVAKFYNAAARDEYCRLLNLDPAEIAHQLVAIPTSDEAIVYGRVKQTLRDIEKNVAEYLYHTGQEIGEFRLFLTGTGNFRDELATLRKYKGNRDRSTRPYWYKEIREYLERRWGAEVVDGMEADDAVSILQWEAKEGATIICTIDKDLENVPGHFYNYHHKEARFITYEEATLNFYRQMLTGDNSDNIPGLYKVGKVKAAKILPEYEDEWIMWTKVVLAYKENMREYPEHFECEVDGHELSGAVEAAIENATLLYMLQKPGETWEPPNAP
ncbi:hypothetical protein CMI47_04605 [Candidatus Pacearchaeota archaeon]|jgi:hypothetical protein|nr:hypothetical protein [Candidatus Pacearchaeota archaeon]|tara:strand:- start:10642 stop:11595 length:954 start_codon:yes stop_codon:yes gene_type:complete